MSQILALLGSTAASGTAPVKPLFTGLSEVTVSDSSTFKIDFNLTSGDFADYTTFFFRCSMRGVYVYATANTFSQRIDDRSSSYAYSGADTHWGCKSTSTVANPGGNASLISYFSNSLADNYDDAGRFTWFDCWFSGSGTTASSSVDETIYGEVVNSDEPENQYVQTASGGYNTDTPTKLSFGVSAMNTNGVFLAGTRIQAYGVTYGYAGE